MLDPDDTIDDISHRIQALQGAEVPPITVVPPFFVPPLPGPPVAGPLWPSWYEPPHLARAVGNELLRDVARCFGLTVADLKGRGRDTMLVQARSVCARLLRDRGLSYPHVGRILGGRDHSTIIHALDQFGMYCNANAMVRDTYQLMRAREVVDG